MAVAGVTEQRVAHNAADQQNLAARATEFVQHFHDLRRDIQVQLQVAPFRS